MRFAVLAVSLALLGAGPALACIGEAPVHWPSTLREGGPVVFVGRVDRLEPVEGTRRLGAFEVEESTAVVKPVTAVQGVPPSSVRYTAVTKARPLVSDPPMFCGDMQGFRPGQTVVAVQRVDGSFQLLPAERSGAPFLKEKQ